jgi:hypothetical protein
MRKRFLSAVVFLSGFVGIGVVGAVFNAFVVGNYRPGMAFTFWSLVLFGALAGAVCAVLFAAFSALLRVCPNAIASGLLGALSWSLLQAGGKVFGPVAVPSTMAFLLLTASPFVAAIVGRVVVLGTSRAG